MSYIPTELESQCVFREMGEKQGGSMEVHRLASLM